MGIALTRTCASPLRKRREKCVSTRTRARKGIVLRLARRLAGFGRDTDNSNQTEPVCVITLIAGARGGRQCKWCCGTSHTGLGAHRGVR